MEVSVVGPQGQGCRKKVRKGLVERNKTCWLQGQEGGRYCWTTGVYTPQNGKQNWSRGIRQSATKKARTEPDSEVLVGSGTTEQQGNLIEAKQNRKMSWKASSTGPLTNVGPTGALNVKPVIDSVRSHHGSNNNSWNSPLTAKSSCG